MPKSKCHIKLKAPDPEAPDFESIHTLQQLISYRFSEIARGTTMALKIGWFTTVRDQAAIDLFDAVYDALEKGDINGGISFVFSNREKGESTLSDRFFQQIQRLQIPLVCFSSSKYLPEMRKSGKEDVSQVRSWRTRYDREIIARIEELSPDIIVLAGYMLVTSAAICGKYNMINLHPALPGGPIGTWQEVIWQLIKEKRDTTGAMMHLVTEELDKGPAISYYDFSTRGEKFDPFWKELEQKIRIKSLDRIIEEEGESNHLFASIRTEGAKREIPLLVKTLAEFARGRLKIENGQVVAGGKVQSKGYCLTQEVEEYLNNRA